MDIAEHLREPLFAYLLRLGDDSLVLGQRLSEWCGHGPVLEEDIALTNIALDCVGQAESMLRLAGEVEGAGRSQDDLAYHRDEVAFRNALLVEQPNGDFGDTIMRQFLFDAFAWHFYGELTESGFAPLAALAAKGHKEVTYHLRHAREWVIRLGDGTDESRRRISASLARLWPFTDELFLTDEVDRKLILEGIAPDMELLRGKVRRLVETTLAEATLEMPEDPPFWPEGGRSGRHSEHLGHMLATMQILARSHPGAAW